MLEYHKMTEEEKYCIARWKYPGEYAIYNSLSYEEQKKRGFGFANPENHLYSFYDGKDLVGFINLNGEEPIQQTTSIGEGAFYHMVRRG